MGLINALVVTTLPYVPKWLVAALSNRYIAGDSLAHAITVCRNLNKLGAMATIDLLGEQIKDADKAADNVTQYFAIWDAIVAHRLDANVSLKPTSFGATFDLDLCQANIRKIVDKAAAAGQWLTIDMEDHPYTDLTLKLYHALRQEFPKNIGTVLQAYLKRTGDDAGQIVKGGPTNLRLCKGIYREPDTIAFKDKRTINANYLTTLELLLAQGAYVGIATHDDILVNGALQLIQKYKLPREQYEFQMLLGVRPELRDRLLKLGHRLRIYVPFGKDWYAYSLRRLKENPSIAGSVIRGLLFDRHEHQLKSTAKS